MPQCCVVLECSNRKSGHRFPKDKDLCKKWMVAIRRDKVIQGGKVREVLPSVHWRVCNEHFAPEDFVSSPRSSGSKNPRLKKNVVPSRFAWTKEEVSNQGRKKQERDSQLQSHIVTTRPLENHFLVTKPTINSVPPPLLYFSQPSEAVEEIEHVNVDKIKAEPVDLLDRAAEAVFVEGAEFHVETEYHEIAEFHVETKCHEGSEVQKEAICPTKDASVQCSLCSCESLSGENSINASQCSNDTFLISPYFRIEHLINKPDELKFYTGFDDYHNFMYVFNSMGDQVNRLHYFPLDQTSILPCILTPVNEFFMTLVTLRRNMTFVELGFRFGVTSTVAGIIVVTWINFIHSQLKRLKLWALPEVIENNLKKERENCGSNEISDSTDGNISNVKSSVNQQHTYIIYKFSITFRVVIGISPQGSITFVSDAFEDSISDEELFKRCSFTNILQDKDVLVYDQSSVIRDIIANIAITVKTTDFIEQKPDQFKRVTSLGKAYNILQSKLPSELEQFASGVIHVCFMLAHF